MRQQELDIAGKVLGDGSRRLGEEGGREKWQPGWILINFRGHSGHRTPTLVMLLLMGSLKHFLLLSFALRGLPNELVIALSPSRDSAMKA